MKDHRLQLPNVLTSITNSIFLCIIFLHITAVTVLQVTNNLTEIWPLNAAHFPPLNFD